MKKTFIFLPFVLIFYLIVKFNDTKTFQEILKFFFNPDSKFLPPIFWQNYRLYILSFILILIILFYNKTWIALRSLIKTYRITSASPQKPNISAKQASFLYLNDQSRYFMVWIIDMCTAGSFSLHYKKEYIFPWFIKKEKPNKIIGSFDEEMQSILFKEGDILQISPRQSNPNPNIKEVAEKLFKKEKSESSNYYIPKQTNLVAWIFYIVLILEIPLYNASFPKIPAMIVTTFFSSIFFVFPFKVLAKQLPTLFSGSYKSYFLLSFSFIFALLVQFFFNWRNQPYLATGLLPTLSVSIAVFVNNLPFFLKDSFLLSSIIGYKKYLARNTVQIKEEYLPWTLGLNSNNTNSLNISENIPNWLKSNGKDTTILIKSSNKSLYDSINKAVYGDYLSKRNTIGNRVLDRP